MSRRRRWAGGGRVVLGLFLAVAQLPALTGPGQDASAAALLDELSGAPAARRSAIAQELMRLGEPAALAALEGLGARGLDERRLLAAVVREAGGASAIPAAIARMDDPDGGVRAELLGFISRIDFSGTLLPDRCAALGAAALEDPDGALRRQALNGLARLDSEEALDWLDRLIDLLPAAERPLAAEALGGTPKSRERVVARVQRGFVERAAPSFALPPTPADVLAVLLAGAYGQALAEMPGGGTAPRDLVPLVQGPRHPDPAVRHAALVARDNLIGRLRYLGDVARADRILADLLGRGLDDRALCFERANLALAAAGDPEATLAAARAVAVLSSPQNDFDGRIWSFRAAYAEAVAQLAADRPEEALPPLARAERVLAGLTRERLDLRSLGTVFSERAHNARANLALLEGLVHVTRGLALLCNGRAAADPELLEEMRRAHLASLSAQLWRTRGEGSMMAVDIPLRRKITLALMPPRGSIDELIDHPLSPARLIFTNPRLTGWPRARAFARQTDLFRALATVAPREVIAFDALDVSDPELRDPALDPERRDLLREIQDEEFSQLRAALLAIGEQYRETEELDPSWWVLNQRATQLQNEREQDAEAGFVSLHALRVPSDAALDLVHDLREEGRIESSRRLAERMLAELSGELERSALNLSSVDRELRMAQVEMALGAAFTSEDAPERAEEVLLRALERLESVESEVQSGGYGPETQRRVAYELSSVLVSLAVNANVKLEATERAVAYFERAYALRSDDFMRVLLACYRARAGRAEEARALLRETPASPSTYYNLACTWALLGEEDLALDFLQRELLENHHSSGSRRQQQEWAARDPDLESLRGLPRFERLLSGD